MAEMPLCAGLWWCEGYLGALRVYLQIARWLLFSSSGRYGSTEKCHDWGMTPPSLPHLINTAGSDAQICVYVCWHCVFAIFLWQVWGKTRASAFREMTRAYVCCSVFKCEVAELSGISPELTFYLALSRDGRHTHMKQAYPISRSITQPFAISYFTLSTVNSHTDSHPLSLCVSPSSMFVLQFVSMCPLWYWCWIITRVSRLNGLLSLTSYPWGL